MSNPLHRKVTAGSLKRTSGAAKKKLSYLEAREYATPEHRIAEAEDQLKAARTAYADPAIANDAERLIAAQTELGAETTRSALRPLGRA